MATLRTTFGRRRAVLISGGISTFQNYPRYLNDIVAFFDCLVGPRYRFDPADIEVVYANGGAYDMGGHPVVARHATEAAVKDAIARAVDGDPARGTSALAEDDLLVLLTTNHGDSSTRPHRLLLWDPAEFIESPDFADAITPTAGGPPEFHCLGIFGHCFGADMFAQFLKKGHPDRTVAVAASKTASYALSPDCAYDAFLYHFTAALALKTPSGYPANADANGDGHVHLQEAYDFAVAMDRSKDQQDIDDGGSGLAATLTLEGLL